MVVAFVGWIWHLYRRAQGRVAGRIKEIKSNAADVMDRLDGLKERLKLMPTSTEFKQPMTGETQALYKAVNEKLGKLWDGWLHVMDVLEKAQKLAARSGSPLSQKTLAEAEELMARQGSFAEIEAQAQAICGRRGPARPGPPGGAHGARGGHRGPPQDRCGARRDQKAGLADGPLPGRAGGCRRGIESGELGAGRRPTRDHDSPRTASVAVGRLPGADRASRVALWRRARSSSRRWRRSNGRWPGIGRRA